ncbi:MAG: hypothetical protein ACYCVO_08760 [Acidimicrobiales bacterium]
MNESEQFATLWADNRVEKALTGQITIRRPPVGIIRLDVTEPHRRRATIAHALHPGPQPRIDGSAPPRRTDAGPTRRVPEYRHAARSPTST